jgi:hypothetical protein
MGAADNIAPLGATSMKAMNITDFKAWRIGVLDGW